MTENEEIQYDEMYTRDRMRQNKQDRSFRKTNMWLRRLKVLLRLITVVILIALTYYLLKLPQWYMSKDAFNTIDNSSLEIINNKIVPSYNILAALRKSEVPKVPLYLYNTRELKSAIMQLDPIQDVFIRRFWFPARLQIIIQERKPLITIAPAENVEPIAFFAEGGKLIGRDYLPLSPSFKTIRVLTYGARGDDYRNWKTDRIDAIQKLAKTLEVTTKTQVEYIDLRVPNDIYVQLKGIKIRLGELDDSVYDRVKRIPSIMPQVTMLDKKMKYLDLRWKDSAFIKLEE